MRPLWKGAISFGLVYVPVKLYAATEQKDIRFNYLHQKCKTGVHEVQNELQRVSILFLRRRTSGNWQRPEEKI